MILLSCYFYKHLFKERFSSLLYGMVLRDQIMLAFAGRLAIRVHIKHFKWRAVEVTLYNN